MATPVDERLNKGRMHRNLSWSELADAAGLSVAGLGRIRRGEVNPKEDTKRRLEKALGLPDRNLDDLWSPAWGEVAEDSTDAYIPRSLRHGRQPGPHRLRRIRLPADHPAKIPGRKMRDQAAVDIRRYAEFIEWDYLKRHAGLRAAPQQGRTRRPRNH